MDFDEKLDRFDVTRKNTTLPAFSNRFLQKLTAESGPRGVAPGLSPTKIRRQRPNRDGQDDAPHGDGEGLLQSEGVGTVGLLKFPCIPYNPFTARAVNQLAAQGLVGAQAPP